MGRRGAGRESQDGPGRRIGHGCDLYPDLAFTPVNSEHLEVPVMAVLCCDEVMIQGHKERVLLRRFEALRVLIRGGHARNQWHERCHPVMRWCCDTTLY